MDKSTTNKTNQGRTISCPSLIIPNYSIEVSAKRRTIWISWDYPDL